MKNCKIHVRNEVWSTITGLSFDHNAFLWDKFGPYVEGYRHMLPFKLGRWDGKVRFFEKTGKTYTRLLPRMLSYIETWGYDIELVDDRPFYEKPVLLNDRPFPNQDIQLRPYQVQCCNLAIENGEGFIVAGTGAGKCIFSNTPINIKVSDELARKIKEIENENLASVSTSQQD